MRPRVPALGLALLAWAGAAGAGPFEAHSAKAREFYGRGDLAGAAAEFQAALKLKPKDANAIISLAGIYMTQGKMKESESAFLSGVKLLKPKEGSLLGYCWSRLGDIALLRGDLDVAKYRYERTLAYNPKDANAQIGLGVYAERKGGLEEAARAYEAGLALEPGNHVAQEGLRRVRQRLRYSQDPAEMLAEMKARKIVEAAREAFKPEELELLIDMRTAEEDGGIDFLKERQGFLGPDIVETKDKAGNIRLMFTKASFAKYKAQFTQAAIADLEKAGVELKYLYYLEDLDEKPLFDEAGQLTPSGVEIYRKMRRGEAVQWKLPGQELPGEAARRGGRPPEEKDPQVQALLQAGYVEITQDEENWIERAGGCTEDQLEQQYSLKSVKAPMNRVRYFLSSRDPLTAGVARYRQEGDAATLTGTAFFGSGAKLCH